jgi:hypothetical protein
MWTVDDMRHPGLVMTEPQCKAMINFVESKSDGMIYRGEFKIMSIGGGRYGLATFDALTEIERLYIDSGYMHIVTKNDDLMVKIES